MFKDKAYNATAYVAQSTDGGASFSAPRALTDDPASQRFETIALDPDGAVFAAWLDKRNAVAARAAGQAYAGAALAFAWLDGAAGTITSARIAQDETCECCRLGVAFAGPGRPVVLFRNVFGGKVRDHAITTFVDPETPGPIYRVSTDDWEIDACPHAGPSLAIAPNGSYHAAWFTDGRVRQGLFYRALDRRRPQLLRADDDRHSRPPAVAARAADGRHDRVARLEGIRRPGNRGRQHGLAGRRRELVAAGRRRAHRRCQRPPAADRRRPARPAVPG
ncbi:MAG: hypothetical protein WDO24_22030 [Pseudomonadota bacterium]